MRARPARVERCASICRRKAQAFFAHDRTWCCAQAKQVGPACAELIERLLTDRILERLRAAQGVLRLTQQYGSARLEAACARALAHDSAHYRTVKTILAGGFDQQPIPLSETPNSVYLRQARFVRAARELFNSAEDSAAADAFEPATRG